MSKSKNIITVIAALIICVLVSNILINYNSKASKSHFLNVATETRGSWISSGTTHYFKVYDNGTIEETEKFETTETEIYDLYNIEEILKTDSAKNEDIPIYSSEIIEIINKMENSLVGKYFIVNDRYFFSTTTSETPAKEYSSSLFEYFHESNDIKKIADFQDTYVTNLKVLP